MTDERTYPTRPFLAVSAAIVRDGKLLVVRRARQPGMGWHTFPGGGVELGETLEAAVAREVKEETGLDVSVGALIGHRDVIIRDPGGRVARHFVVLPFLARWTGGEFVLNEEHDAGDWLGVDALAGLKTTEGLAEIAATALRLAGA